MSMSSFCKSTPRKRSKTWTQSWTCSGDSCLGGAARHRSRGGPHGRRWGEARVGRLRRRCWPRQGQIRRVHDLEEVRGSGSRRDGRRPEGQGPSHTLGLHQWTQVLVAFGLQPGGVHEGHRQAHSQEEEEVVRVAFG